MHEAGPGGTPDEERTEAVRTDADGPAADRTQAPDGDAPAADGPPEPEQEQEPGAARPLEVEVRPTGHEPVDAQLRRLADADHLAVSGHLEVYEDVHRGLRSTLTALDQHNPGS